MAKQTNTESGDNPPAGYTPNPPNQIGRAHV